MNLPPNIVDGLRQASRKPRLRWWQLNLRTIFVLVTLASIAAFFHKPLQPLVDWFLELVHLKQRPFDPCPWCGGG